MNKFLSFVKIEHTIFTLPLIYSGVALGSHKMPAADLLVLILLAAVGARTIALTLNRIIDKEIDFRNPRTTTRELPSGKISLKETAVVLVVGALLYFGSAALISKFCLMLSPIPLIIFTVYPYMKRFTVLAHFGVGLGMAMAPLGGWFAVSPSFDNLLSPFLLCVFTIFWGAGFDVIYATLDEEFDRRENLYSLVSKFGRSRALKYSALFHLLGFISLVILFLTSIQTLYALPFLLITGILLWIEHIKAVNVDLAFFKINAILGFVVFAMVITGVIFK